MYNNMAWVGAAVFPYYLAGLGYDTPSGIDIILGCKSVKTHCWACDTWVFSAFFFLIMLFFFFFFCSYIGVARQGVLMSGTLSA
jgi:hypothetical protein